MSDINTGLGESRSYEIDGIVLHQADGTTVIRCPALDQAALHGVLAKVRDLGLSLISVSPTPTSPDETRSAP